MTEPKYSEECGEWYVQDGDSIYFFTTETDARVFTGEEKKEEDNGQEEYL